MSFLYQALAERVTAWREANFPCDEFPAVREILEFATEDGSTGQLRYLRRAQLRALETYWYLRLVLKTPKIPTLYAELFPRQKDRREAMGLGDVDLFMMIGATLGPINSVVVLVLASFIGSFGGGIMILRDKMRREADSPLALGAQLATAPAPEPTPAEAPPQSEDEETLGTRSFADSIELPYVDLLDEPSTPEALAAIGPELRAAHQMWPLAMVDGRLRIACADPLNSRLVTALREAGHVNVEFAIARPSQIAAALDGTLAPRTPASAPADDAGALWRRFVEADSHLPLPPQLHMLPFIPWITIGCLIVLLAWPLVKMYVVWMFYPT